MKAGITENNLIDFLIDNQEYYINLLDKFDNIYTQIPYRTDILPFFFENKLNSLTAYTDEGKIYLHLNNPVFIEECVDFINSKKNYSSIYGESESVKKVIERLFNRYLYYNDYYVMVLYKDDYIYKELKVENYYAIKCKGSHFNNLKELQYLYHKEEVYAKTDFYPYKVEMRAFKKILNKRLCYASFSSDKHYAVSKVNVNAESPDLFQLGGIFTRPEYRKLGLSKLCMTGLIKDVFTESSKKGLVLFVNKVNVPAVNLYTNLGFKILYESTLCYF